MKNYEKWKEISAIRKTCEEFPSKWQEILNDPRMDKKYLQFDRGHNSGIQLNIAAFAGSYGNSSVHNEMPSNDLVRIAMGRVLERNFPEIWKEVILELKKAEKELHSKVLSELEEVKSAIEEKE